ncbi:hypothetical protein [Nocardia rhamnosiphila]
MSAHPWVERAIVPGDSENRVELYAYLPDDPEQARAWLKKVLGRRVPLRQVQRHGVAAWKLSPNHLLRLTAAMAYAYGPTKMRLEVRHTSICDQKCKDAKVTPVWECVCKCAGEFHGGKGPRNGWYPVGRSTIVRHDTTRIDQLIVTDGQLPTPHKKVPRPAAVPPIRPALPAAPALPRPVPAPAATTPPPKFAPVSAPRTVIPVKETFGVPDRGMAVVRPRPAGRSRPVAVTARKSVAGPVAAAVLTFVALAGGIWWVTNPEPPAAEQVTPHDPPHSSPGAPEDETQLPRPPVNPEPPAPRPQLPAGCFPFQLGC